MMSISSYLFWPTSPQNILPFPSPVFGSPLSTEHRHMLRAPKAYNSDRIPGEPINGLSEGILYRYPRASTSMRITLPRIVDLKINDNGQRKDLRWRIKLILVSFSLMMSTLAYVIHCSFMWSSLARTFGAGGKGLASTSLARCSAVQLSLSALIWAHFSLRAGPLVEDGAKRELQERGVNREEGRAPTNQPLRHFPLGQGSFPALSAADRPLLLVFTWRH